MKLRKPALIAGALLLAIVLPLATAQAENEQPETQLLQIILLGGSRSGPSDLETLPANARKAVDDIRDFLPFQAYKVLDASLIRSNREGSTRMSGPDGADYQVEFNFARSSDSSHVMVGYFRVVKVPARTRVLLEPPRSSDSSDRSAPATAEVKPKTVIRTSFEAEVGKTLVVGSSRLNGGDEALIVLFTALR